MRLGGMSQLCAAYYKSLNCCSSAKEAKFPKGSSPGSLDAGADCAMLYPVSSSGKSYLEWRKFYLISRYFSLEILFYSSCLSGKIA